MGFPKFVEDDSGERVEYIDEPQKNKAYLESRAKMNNEKEALIKEKHVIAVKVKSKTGYTFGGRVEGKPKDKCFAGRSGTIIDVVSDDRYLIEWQVVFQYFYLCLLFISPEPV